MNVLKMVFRKMEADHSSRNFVTPKLHGVTFDKIIIFTVTTMITKKLMQQKVISFAYHS